VDVVHVHSAPPPLGLGVARAGLRRLVFTPRAPIQRLLHWPYAHMTQAAVGRALRTVCTSRADADLVRCSFPWAAKRLRVVPTGVDVNAIRAATPLAYPGRVVLTIGPLERRKRIERAIAAMASLDPEFRLVVVGDGPARRRLRAYAADLEVSSRVEFVGWVSEPVLHRWLRTARVIVALAERANAGLPVLEALSAGAPVVASDIQVHHEAASYAAGGGLRFVSPEGSPLEVADASRTRQGSACTPPGRWTSPPPRRLRTACWRSTRRSGNPASRWRGSHCGPSSARAIASTARPGSSPLRPCASWTWTRPSRTSGCRAHGEASRTGG